MHAVKKRLENSLRNRKSTRFSVFDKIRNLPNIESPVPEKKVQSKIEHRRMQLEKWKEEKDKKKKEALLHKKKPFVAGIAHNPLKYLPPLPPPKPLPSTSGRVTRSQVAREKKVPKQSSKTEKKEIKKQESFAPKNAKFKPPVFEKIVELPTLSLPKKIDKKDVYLFNVNIEQNLPNKQLKGKTRKTSPKNQESRTLRSRQPLVAEKNTNTTKKSSNLSKSLSSTSNSSVESNLSAEISCKQKPVKSRTSHKSKQSPHLRNSLSSTSNSSVELNSSGTSSEEKSIKPRTPRKSIQKEKLLTPKNKNVPKSESSSEEKLRSPKSSDVPMTPEQIVEMAKKISPCVTLSRGKDNARKEMKKKIDEGLLDDDICEIESVEHFRMQLDSEIKRMTTICETWDKISEQEPLPDVVQEALLGAVGQARLLMSQKLQQFASLLRRCQQPEPGQALVTPGDLHGFWDMVFMQIENVDMRFKKLEEMRARGWIEEQLVVVKKKVATKPVPRKPAATSRLRDIIAAARKAKKDQPAETVPEEKPEECKTFEAGFFSVHSPIKSPLGSTPSKPTLLKAVLSSEAKKSANKSSSYAMLRASLIGKHVDTELPQKDPMLLTPINFGATPGRSILKSAMKSGKKSIKVVLFDNSDTEELNTQKNVFDPESTEVEKSQELNADRRLSMNTEKQDGKENKSRRKPKLIRQEATEERSPVMTRSRRKSVQTPASVSVDEERSSRRRKTLQEVEVNVKEVPLDTPKRSSRRKS